MELPKANEIKWLEFGTHNASFRTYVKKGDQWYLLTHDEGWIDGARQLDEEEIVEAITEIPEHLARNAHTKGWTVEWDKESFETFDRKGFFMAGEVPWDEADQQEEKCACSIKEILDAVDEGNFREWLDAKYPENY